MRLVIFLVIMFQTALVSAKMNPPPVADQVKVLDLYYVRDGSVQRKSFTRKDLKSSDRLAVDGYVSGVVLFCDGDIEAKVEGQQMNRIVKNDDGTISLKYFRNMRPEELSLSHLDKTYYQKILSQGEKGLGNQPYIPGGYSYFPKITGDAVSSENNFDITIERGGQVYTIPVSQKGSVCFRTVEQDLGSRSAQVRFRYVGTDLAGLKERTKNFEERLGAIAAGICAVEKAYDTELVQYVNIVDYSGIHNAVTCDGRQDMWFYAKTFSEEPVKEMKTIAEHETLHIYVNQNQLPASGDIRELFSDLKGYDTFSIERFAVMTSGMIPPEKGEDEKNLGDTLFFDFINEKNFIKGMKGGHSHENIDEFCTSFLHSLMYEDKLEANLDLPLVPYYEGSETKRIFTRTEQATIMERYIRTIDVIKQAMNENHRRSIAKTAAAPIFDQDLTHAKKIRDRKGLLCQY